MLVIKLSQLVCALFDQILQVDTGGGAALVDRRPAACMLISQRSEFGLLYTLKVERTLAAHGQI